ncbi:MAG: factor-independent urate hydroxylase [Acidimicrobiia bacterium]
MARLGHNRWGKTDVRVSKIHRAEDRHDFSDISVQVLLEGDVGPAHTEGDNSAVLPTDTMRNTIYCLAQDHLTRDLEAFGAFLCDHFLDKEEVTGAAVSISERLWARVAPTGFIGGGTERRIARVACGTAALAADDPDLATEIVAREGVGRATSAGVEGLIVLKTTGSAFSGFPKDQFTVLPETDDRILATSVTATWHYTSLPEDTTRTWERARQAIVDGFFGEWSASVQHQGWIMGQAVLDAVPEIDEIEFHLPNQHHLPFDISRFGMEYAGTVFQPVAEPYGDIGFTITR